MTIPLESTAFNSCLQRIHYVQVIFFQTIQFCFQFQTLNHMVWFCWKWFFKVIRFIHVQFLKKEKLHDSHDSEITKDSSAGLIHPFTSGTSSACTEVTRCLVTSSFVMNGCWWERHMKRHWQNVTKSVGRNGLKGLSCWICSGLGIWFKLRTRLVCNGICGTWVFQWLKYSTTTLTLYVWTVQVTSVSGTVSSWQG